MGFLASKRGLTKVAVGARLRHILLIVFAHLRVEGKVIHGWTLVLVLVLVRVLLRLLLLRLLCLLCLALFFQLRCSTPLASPVYSR